MQEIIIYADDPIRAAIVRELVGQAGYNVKELSFERSQDHVKWVPDSLD